MKTTRPTTRARPARPRAAAAGAAEELDAVFAAVARHFGLLSEPTRLKILNTICREERSVTMIVAATGATQTNVSRHLALLRAAGVVSRRRDGNTVYYGVNDPDLMDICRNVCVQIAGRIDARQPLRQDLLEFAASH
jgi:DNA-binding transcriptional ArsR family regulator